MSNSKPLPHYIRFDERRKRQWKIIPARFVEKIAAKCSKGVDWGGYPKKSIIDDFERTEDVRGATPDRQRFGELMDKAVEAYAKVREFEHDITAEVLK